MNRNIIDAIGTLIKRLPIYLDDPYSTENIHRSARYWSIEDYVKNLFADSFDTTSDDEKNFRQAKIFSHFGNATNPPNLMLRGGDAIEIKNIRLPEKINSREYGYSPLILNKIYPRQKLFADDPLVTQTCRNAERWKEKDIIYAVGVSRGKQLTNFCMVYGRDYCASAQHYEKILQEMRARLKDIPNMTGILGERYLGRADEIDPIGATYLDLRNEWYIKSPWDFFGDVYRPNPHAKFNFMCIINEEKFYQLENARKVFAWAEISSNLSVEHIRIKNPDIPKQKRNALLIQYEVK